MFQLIGKSLLALAATVMLTHPVVACCLSPAVATADAVRLLDQTTPSSKTPTETTRPCHGAAETTTATVPTETASQNSDDCPMCGSVDCALLMTADSVEPVIQALSEKVNDDYAPIASTQTFKAYHANAPPPPGEGKSSLRAAVTPVSLHQRLLN